MNKILKLNDPAALQYYLFEFQNQELGLQDQKCALSMRGLFHHM